MLETIITSSVLIITLLLLRAALKGKISSRLRYGLWLAVVVRLLLPFPLTKSPISVMNLFTSGENSATSAISGFLHDIAESPEESAGSLAGAVPRNDLPDISENPDNTDIDHISDTLDRGDISVSMYRYKNSDNAGNTDTAEDIALANDMEDRIIEEYLAAVADSAIADKAVADKAAVDKAAADNAAANNTAANDRGNANTPLIPENTSADPSENIPDNPDAHGGFPYAKIIIVIWASVAAAGLLWFGAVNIAFGKKLRKCRREVHCASPLPVYRADFLKSPCLFGKAVYINEQPEKHLKYIIAHEYSHYCHGDHIWSAVRQILLCIYWFNPLVWAAAVISKNDCECACDEAAMELIDENDRTEYGRALLEMIPSKGGNIGIAATSMSGRGRALAERLRLIAAKPLSKRSAKVIAAKAAAVAVSLIACGCTFTTSQSLEQDNDTASNADNGIAVTQEYPAPAHNERQYQVNAANRSYETYLHTYDNYKEFYENHAAEVYADSLTINPDEFGEFSAFFNLWIKYRNKTMETVRINYSPEDEKFYAGEPFEVSYIPQFAEDYLTLLPDKPYEEVIADSWEAYLKTHYPCDLYDGKLLDEPVEEVWIIDPIADGEYRGDAGFLVKSKSYYWRQVLAYFPDSIYPDEIWHQPGSGDMPHKIEDNPEVANEGSTLAQTREEYYSRQKYHPGDVLHSFKKQVPLSDGSGTVTRTVQLVMTKEDYPNGLPSLNYTLQGDFALRILDSEGNVTGECPIGTAAVDVNGNTTVTASRDYMSLYFKFSKMDDRLLVFSVPSGYHKGGWHYYTAFFGITDEGELFRYHIDKGEFDYPTYMGGDELFTGTLYSNSRLYSESNAMVNKGEQYLVSIARDHYTGSDRDELLSIITFDETARIVKNAYSLTGSISEETNVPLTEVMNARYSYLFHSLYEGNTKEISDTYSFNGIIVSGENLQDYFEMPMGDITGQDLFYALSVEAAERHRDNEDLTPFTTYGEREYVIHYHSDYMGDVREYTTDAAMTEKREDGSCYVYFVSFGCDYYSVCRYTAREKDGQWVFDEFVRVL